MGGRFTAAGQPVYRVCRGAVSHVLRCPPDFVLVYHQHVDLFRLSGFFHETGFQRGAFDAAPSKAMMANAVGIAIEASASRSRVAKFRRRPFQE